jgi:hypothetical protein
MKCAWKGAVMIYSRPEKMRKITNTSSQDSQLQGPESNKGLFEYEAGVVTIQPLCFITLKDSR